MKQSSGSGGDEAQASGLRDPGAPEDVTFTKKEHLRTTKFDPTGTIITTLPFDGDMPKGEALVEYKKIIKATQKRAQKVEREALPVEYRERVLRYTKSLQHQVDGDDE
jgi:hypothetical protein